MAANLVVTSEPARVGLLFAVPALIALAPVVWGGQTVVVSAAGLLAAWCLVSLASVGILYLPAAVLMGVAALRFRRPSGPMHPGLADDTPSAADASRSRP